jgi:prepilin-type N-terminal cleavage/methylation domain-containing protein
MTRIRDEAGFSLVEMLVGMTVFCLAVGGIAGLLVQNSQINRTQQMREEAQANARTCLSMIVQVLRSAGYDPRNTGFASLGIDSTPLDPTNWIEVFADLNEDGDTGDANEAVLIRHTSERIEWRTTSDVSQPFVILADSISNDADGDGTVEPMFVPDSTTDPSIVTVRITARSPTPDPRTRQFLRYTVTSDVVVRKNV